MKHRVALPLIVASLMAAPALTHAQPSMKGGDMKGMEMKGDMKGMDMKDMSPSGMAKDAKPGKHVTRGTVKSIDAKAGTVTLDHEPVKSVNWPAMTMTFKVQEKALLAKLATGKKAEVEFEQRGKDYVITKAK